MKTIFLFFAIPAAHLAEQSFFYYSHSSFSFVHFLHNLAESWTQMHGHKCMDARTHARTHDEWVSGGRVC